MPDTLSELFKVIVSRRPADPEHSYVASLHQAGLDKILEKVGEESIELILAAKNQEPGGPSERLISEMADLWFHCLIALSQFNLRPEDVIEELDRRLGTSGIEEKAARKASGRE